MIQAKDLTKEFKMPVKQPGFSGAVRHLFKGESSNGFGVVYLRQVITDVFSGALLPLSFFPMWFQKLSGFLPFQASVYLPTQIFLGRVEGRELVSMLLLQAVWIVVMWIGAKLFFRFAIKKVTIQGG